MSFSTIIEFDDGNEVCFSTHTPPQQNIEQATQIAYHNASEMLRIMNIFGITRKKAVNKQINIKQLLTYAKWLAETGEEV